jgi:hypothetical protein
MADSPVTIAIDEKHGAADGPGIGLGNEGGIAI